MGEKPGAMIQLSVEVDAAPINAQMPQFVACLSELPEETAEHVGNEFLRLLEAGGLEVVMRPTGAATGAGDRVVRFEIVGLDELITAAFLAAGVDPADFHGAPR